MMDTENESLLDRHLKYLKLPFMREQHHPLAKQAATDGWSHEDYLEKLADGEAALRQAWEQQKAAERATRNVAPFSSQMDGVARALPALIRAEKLQKRAARVGFDWPDAVGAFAKTREEFDEVEAELRTADTDRLQDELGDMLFAMVNVVRLLGCDAEQTLSRANEKFERRFRHMEKLQVQAGGNGLEPLSLEELERLWERAKTDERNGEV